MQFEFYFILTELHHHSHHRPAPNGTLVVFIVVEKMGEDFTSTKSHVKLLKNGFCTLRINEVIWQFTYVKFLAGVMF